MTDVKKKEAAPKDISRLADFKYVYSTDSRIRISPNEAMIGFGVSDDPQGGNSVVYESVAIVLPARHLKILSHALGEAVKYYEAKYGNIDVKIENVIKADDLIEAEKK